MRTKLIDKEPARAAGYRALTSSYQLPEQQRMLDNVLADIRPPRQKGGAAQAIVATR